MSENNIEKFAGVIIELFLGMLILVIGLALTPTIALQSTYAAGNTTGVAAVLVPFVVVVWVMVIIIIAVMLIYTAIKTMRSA
jgi:hypothetical protein